jgi:hypothetical protein
MGYETAIHLIDLKIKPDSIPVVKRILKSKKGRGLRPIVYFLEHAVLDSEDFLRFKPSKDYDSPYDPDEEDGTVPALIGKWHEGEQIARWLKQHSEKDGRLIQHSCEGDGAAWGWEFDGRGRMREMSLRSIENGNKNQRCLTLLPDKRGGVRPARRS